jgi:uncharacterized glyoxalase superfamily protein PhnB
MHRPRNFGGPVNQSMPAATVIPVLHYPDVLSASAWLCRVFGFEERLRISSHRLQLAVGDGAIVVAAMPKAGSRTDPLSVSIMVRVQSADEHYEAAKSAGAQIATVPTMQPYGERQYTARDLAGYVWTFSQSVANVEPSAWGGELIA